MRQFYAFDILISDGAGSRCRCARPTNLARLLARRIDGIFPSDFEQGRDRPGSIPACLPDGARRPGLETPRPSVSGGPSKHWVKVKNPDHPAYRRVQDQF
jgi:bifunctional non-homologous end joining protein LigD